MKKITLIAAAVLTASTAMAVRPVANNYVRPQSVNQAGKALVANRSALHIEQLSRAGEETVIPADRPSYVATETFYIGISRDFTGYKKQIGVMPAKGSARFSNLLNQEGTWSWQFFDFSAEAPVDTTAISNDLVIKTKPASFIRDLTLVADETTYCDSVAEYLAGDPGFYGFDTAGEGEEPTEDDIFGVSACGTRDFRGSLSMTNLNRKPGLADKKDYDSNGLYTGWYDIFEKENYTDLQLTGYTIYVPCNGDPFLLSSLYFPVTYKTTDDVTLSINVYETGEKNTLGKQLGKGSVTLPAGNTEELFPEIKSYMASAYLRATTAAGLSTASPIAVYKPVTIVISGIDNEAVQQLNVSFQIGAKGPEENDAWRDPYYSQLYANHAGVNFAAKDSLGVDTTFVSRVPWVIGFGGEENEGFWFFPRDIYAFYNITYPYVENAYIGEEGFNFDAPAEGGNEVFVIDSNLDIAQLYDDMLIDAEASADWVDFEVGMVESGNHTFSAVNVTADALPEGVAGRKATIAFTGYAADFTIEVTQGDPDASINEVAAAVAKGNKVYDLQGRQVKNAARGIFISNGKKILL